MDVSEEDKMTATQEAMLQATQTESYQGDSGAGDMSVDDSGNIGGTGMGGMPGGSDLW